MQSLPRCFTLLAKLGLHELPDELGAGLLGGGARKVIVGPDEPTVYSLKPGEQVVGALHCGFRIDAAVSQDQYRAGLCIASTRRSHYHTIPNLGLATQSSLQVGGINLHSFRGYDHIFLAPFKI